MATRCGRSAPAPVSRRSAISIPRCWRRPAPISPKAQGDKPGFEDDFRRVLDDKEIDAVMIATPDHWHARMAILACQAGKDVYVEKPLCQTIHEGQMIRDAARKHNRVVQVGTQRRSMEHIRGAAEFVASGNIGKVPLIKAWINQIRIDIGKPADGAPPHGRGLRSLAGPRAQRVRSTKIASTTPGASSGTTATARSATRASMCSMWRSGRFN